MDFYVLLSFLVIMSISAHIDLDQFLCYLKGNNVLNIFNYISAAHCLLRSKPLVPCNQPTNKRPL